MRVVPRVHTPSGRVLLGVAAVAGMALAMGSAPAHANLIDDFLTDQTITRSGVGTSSIGMSGVSGAIFSERYIEATITAGSASQRVSSNGLNPGELTHSQDAGVTGHSLVIWDGDSSNGPVIDMATAVDLTDAGASNSIAFKIISDDWPTNLTFTVYTTPTDFSRMTYATPGLLSNVVIYLPFASFTDFGDGADFANVGALTLSIAETIPHEDLDIRIELVESTTPPGIPEPMTLGMFGAGLAGFVIARRRRNAPSATTSG